MRLSANNVWLGSCWKCIRYIEEIREVHLCLDPPRQEVEHIYMERTQRAKSVKI